MVRGEAFALATKPAGSSSERRSEIVPGIPLRAMLDRAGRHIYPLGGYFVPTRGRNIPSLNATVP